MSDCSGHSECRWLESSVTAYSKSYKSADTKNRDKWLIVLIFKFDLQQVVCQYTVEGEKSYSMQEPLCPTVYSLVLSYNNLFSKAQNLRNPLIKGLFRLDYWVPFSTLFGSGTERHAMAIRPYRCEFFFID
jgi:hypothetical protein